jgi:steroid delta-isomerase
MSADHPASSAGQRVPRAVDNYFAALRAGNPDLWLTSFSENVVLHDPVGSEPVNGKHGLRAMYSGMASLFARFDGIAEDEVFTAGNSVGVRWTASGVSRAGDDVRWSGISVFFLAADELIETIYAVWDAPAVMVQLSPS